MGEEYDVGKYVGRICDGIQLFALAAPLITMTEGTKMGKTTGEVIWLNKNRFLRI
jgi:tyrosyl-tRNA synthetase